MKKIILIVGTQKRSLREWAKLAGISPQAMHDRKDAIAKRRCINPKELSFSQLSKNELIELTRLKDEHELSYLQSSDLTKRLNITKLAKDQGISRQSIYIRLSKVGKKFKTVEEALGIESIEQYIKEQSNG